MQTIPPDVRPRIYSALELVLDAWHAARSAVDTDSESLLIYFCVCEATMRPMMVRNDTPIEVLTAVNPPEAHRGSMSMLMVSDKLGLPRETVRRKIKALVKSGMLLEDDEGKIRVVPRLTEPKFLAAANEVHEAVRRYHERLKQLGISPPEQP